MHYLILLTGLLLPGLVLAEEDQSSVTVEEQMPGLEPITQDISGRLDRLEQYLNNSALLDMLDLLEQLKLEVNELRGQIEIQTYNIEQLQQKQRDLYTDVDGRLQRIEKDGYISDSAKSDVKEDESDKVAEVEEVAAAPAPPDPIKEQNEYQSAFRLLKESRYEQALTAFKQYLQDYPDSSYSDNAQYWLGETHYVMQQYDLAINEYQALLKTYPDSQKASHSLLKIGYSYAELGNNSDAEKTLNEVKSTYPGTTAARLANDRLRKLMSQKESNS